MAEFLAIGAHAVRRGEIAAGQRVADRRRRADRRRLRDLRQGARRAKSPCSTRARIGCDFCARGDRRRSCRARRTRMRARRSATLTVGRLLRLRVRLHRLRQGDEGGLSLCRAWRRLCARQHRARRHLLRRSRVPQARDDAARQPQRDARGFRRGVRDACAREISRPRGSTPIAPRSTRRRAAFPHWLKPVKRRRQSPHRDLSHDLPHPAIRHQPLPPGPFRSVRRPGLCRGLRQAARSRSCRRPPRPTARAGSPSSIRAQPYVVRVRGLDGEKLVDEEVERRQHRPRRRRQCELGAKSSGCSSTRRAGSSPTPAIAAMNSTRAMRSKARVPRAFPAKLAKLLHARFRAGARAADASFPAS